MNFYFPLASWVEERSKLLCSIIAHNRHSLLLNLPVSGRLCDVPERNQRKWRGMKWLPVLLSYPRNQWSQHPSWLMLVRWRNITILLLMLVMQLLGFGISLVQKFFRGCRKIEFQSKRSATLCQMIRTKPPCRCVLFNCIKRLEYH